MEGKESKATKMLFIYVYGCTDSNGFFLFVEFKHEQIQLISSHALLTFADLMGL